MSNLIFATRLKSARKMAGLSLEELSEKIKGAVSKQSISKYELGVMFPDSRVLIELSRALKVKPDYFFSSQSFDIEEFEFRKKAKLGKKEEETIKEKAKDYLGRYLEIEELLGINKEFENPLSDLIINTPEDAEEAAIKLRERWNLGSDSIPNLIETLEDNELKICEIEASDSFDGLIPVGDKYPIIVINKNISDIPRKRFTIAHELGHLFLTINSEDKKVKENLCHRFANAFILPKDKFINEIGSSRSSFSLSELILIKKEFGISLQAIVKRAESLGIITNSKYRNICIRFNQNGWNKNEPGETYEGKEEPYRFEKLVSRAVVEEIISISKAAYLLNTSIQELNKKLITII